MSTDNEKYSKKAVLTALRDNIKDPSVIRRVMENLAHMEEPKENEEEKAPPVKKQFSVVVSDPRGIITTDLVAWVVQIPEDESPASVLERVYQGADAYSTSKKGRLYPCKTVGEAMENIPAKFFKEFQLAVKTKTPVLVIRSNNELMKLAHA